MLGTHHAVKHLSAALVIAVSLAIAAAAPASAARAHSKSCRDATPTWITVLDDQGVPTLQPVAPTFCADALVCPTLAGGATSSPYPGWVSVTDDTGVPWLYPIGLTFSTYGETCTKPSAPDPAGTAAATQTDTRTPAVPILQSPYKGWVIVTDENGVPWLYPIGHTSN
jgi:hypothetical protein